MTGRGATATGIVARAVRGKHVPTGSLAACGVGLVLFAAGCGAAARNAGEPKGSFALEVLKARFPARQAIARDTALDLVVRNAGTRTIPNVAVTLDSLSYMSTYPHLADRERPTWIVNTGPGRVPVPPVETEQVTPPGGGETVFVHTWALGALAPGASKSFVWLLTPIRAGTHTVHYTVAAGLDGKARARLKTGGPVTGSFAVSVAPAPPHTHVNEQTGGVVAGANPVPVASQPAAP